MAGLLLAAAGLLGLFLIALYALHHYTDRAEPDDHEGATEAYAGELQDATAAPDTSHLPATRQETLAERDELSRILNDVEADLFAGLTDVLDRVLAQLDVSWADLAEHDWDGVRELAGVA